MKDLSHDDAGKDLNPHPVPYYTSSMGLSFSFFLKIQILQGFSPGMSFSMYINMSKDLKGF